MQKNPILPSACNDAPACSNLADVTHLHATDFASCQPKMQTDPAPVLPEVEQAELLHLGLSLTGPRQHSRTRNVDK